MTEPVRLADYRRRPRFVCFTRAEMNQLLALYSRRVAAGEWKAYAFDVEPGFAAFSVFRHAAADPVYTIIKAKSNKGRPFRLLQGSRRVKDGAALVDILSALPKGLQLVKI
jgi:uncharacterized protein DUF2794